MALMGRAFHFLVVLIFTACGDPSAEPSDGAGKGAIECSELPSYLCSDYPEQCRSGEADLIYTGILECYAALDTSIGCSDRSDCDEAEWFAQVGDETLRVRGCVNDVPEGMTIISEPSSELAAAAETTCEQRFQLLDEYCSGFTGADCPVREGCEVDTRQVLDPERGCATGDTYDACVRGIRFLQIGEFESLPCE